MKKQTRTTQKEAASNNQKKASPEIKDKSGREIINKQKTPIKRNVGTKVKKSKKNTAVDEEPKVDRYAGMTASQKRVAVAVDSAQRKITYSSRSKKKQSERDVYAAGKVCGGSARWKYE